MSELLKHLIVLSMVIVLSGNLSANESKLTYVESILYRENVDLDVKSLKGWMRVFNSNSKLIECEIFISIEEKERILLFLKEEYKHKLSRYDKVVR